MHACSHMHACMDDCMHMYAYMVVHAMAIYMHGNMMHVCSHLGPKHKGASIVPSTMPKRGISSREKAAAQTRIQCLNQKSIMDQIVKHLTEHPEEAGPCLVALQDGMLKPSKADGASLRLWLPDSNSQLRHVAAYFVVALLACVDPRLSDQTLVDQLAANTTEEYTRLKVPKDQRISWAHQLMCRLFVVETHHPVPTRYNHKFIELFKERFKSMQVMTSDLPLNMVGGKCPMDYKIHGLYKLKDPDPYP